MPTAREQVNFILYYGFNWDLVDKRQIPFH